MGCGIRPATPGTFVVAVATILLILVSVSVPMLKSIYFLKATVAGTEITLGCWGYCSGSTCTSATLGYSLDLDTIFGYDGVEGIAATSSIPTTLVKWLTYVLVLHPVAAAFAVISLILGLLAHIREFTGTCLTTFFASFGAVTALIAFAFDLGLFIVAKKRIESSSVGGTAELGAALWMTLIAMLCLMFSGCFFGCGRCMIRDTRRGREASEKTRPVVDSEFGSKMRDEAMKPGYSHNNTVAWGDNSYSNGGLAASSYGNNTRRSSGREGSLPIFADRDGEIVPLTAIRHDDDDDDGSYPPQRQSQQYQGGYIPSHSLQRDDSASLVSGVGQGYGRRTDAAPGAGIPISLASGASYRADMADRRANSGVSSTVEPFTGMSALPAVATAGASGLAGPRSPVDVGSPGYQYPQYDAYNANGGNAAPAPPTSYNYNAYHDPYQQHDSTYAPAPLPTGEKSQSSYYTPPGGSTPSGASAHTPQYPTTYGYDDRGASPPPVPSYSTHQPDAYGQQGGGGQHYQGYSDQGAGHSQEGTVIYHPPPQDDAYSYGQQAPYGQGQQRY